MQHLDHQSRVEPRKRIAQPSLQHHLPVVGGLGPGHVGGDVSLVGDVPVEIVDSRERSFLDDGFGEADDRGALLTFWAAYPDTTTGSMSG